MIADLHCHYPMHVMMDDPRDRLTHMTRVRGRLVFSVLHSPFNEIDLGKRYGSPPESS